MVQCKYCWNEMITLLVDGRDVRVCPQCFPEVYEKYKEQVEDELENSLLKVELHLEKEEEQP